MSLKRAELKSFDGGSYTAAVRMDGGYKTDLEGVPVARNLPSIEMVAGRMVAVQFLNDTSPREAVIIAVYTP